MGKTTMRMVYVATPYAGLSGVSETNRPSLARYIAKNVCARVREAGYIPISPVLAFSDIFDEQKDRECVLDAGLELLSHCSYVYVYDLHPDAFNSEGMRKEREYARELGISELDLDGGLWID